MLIVLISMTMMVFGTAVEICLTSTLGVPPTTVVEPPSIDAVWVSVEVTVMVTTAPLLAV